MALDPDTLTQLLDTVERFVREKLVQREEGGGANRPGPADVITEMRALGLFGLSIPVFARTNPGAPGREGNLGVPRRDGTPALTVFTISRMMGARAFETHLATYWPEWGVNLIDRLEKGEYAAIQRDVVSQVKPFYKLWMEIEKDYTAGDGYLNKLCMELVGLDSSRCRPPTRDVRERYRERARQMLIETGAPRVSRSTP